MKEEFEVLNIKCGGCIDSIRKGIGELEGVSQVSASLEGEVTVEGDNLDRDTIADKLDQLGFPEA